MKVKGEDQAIRQLRELTARYSLGVSIQGMKIIVSGDEYVTLPEVAEEEQEIRRVSREAGALDAAYGPAECMLAAVSAYLAHRAGSLAVLYGKAAVVGQMKADAYSGYLR